MGMEVGVATDTVAGLGGRKKRGGWGVTRPAEIRREATYREKGPHCLCGVVFFFLCNPAAIMCNGRRKCVRAPAA